MALILGLLMSQSLAVARGATYVEGLVFGKPLSQSTYLEKVWSNDSEAESDNRTGSSGMLYDCRSDSLIPGVTLWDLKALQTDLNVQSQPNTEFHIIASDSIEKKASALNVNGSLKASFLGGLIEVKGSAKYLNDMKSSKHQAHVTLQYRTTTRFEQLSMSHLGRQNVTYPYVFDQGTATHVVTAVLYGAQAFFVFDQEVSSTETLQDIQGNLEVMIKIIPGIAVEGQASLEMTNEQKSDSHKFSCTFYGDFSLENNPTTFQDAIKIFRTLPKLLGPDGDHAVPMSVWLYPLNKLDSKAAQLVRDISIGLVNRSQSVLEQLNEAVMRCNDMMRDSVTIQFPEIGNRIMKFREMCLEHKLVFQKTLARVLPSIRGGGVEEGLLVDILKNKEQSPFKHQSLIKWLDDKEREMNVVRYYLMILKDIQVVKSRSELDREVLNPEAEYVVCFTFTSLHQEDFYLSGADSYLQSHTAEEMQIPNPANRVSAEHHNQQWFNSVSVSQKMRECSRLFLDFFTANRARGKTKFIVASVQDDSNVGASIYLYERGFVVSHCFELPSQPERPVVSGTTHDSVTLQLQPPRYDAGEIVGYEVEYRATQQEEWTTVDTSDKSDSYTISGLQPHQEYQFQYRAVTKAGVSMVSESSCVTTFPTSPPGKPLPLQVYWYAAILTWDRPTKIGAGVDIAQYRIEYREGKAITSSTENGLWEEIKTTDSECRYTLEGLKPKTNYRVRVSADCGEEGSSAPSDEVLIKIENEPKRLAEKLREKVH
ncbi:verrucotoxin subunit beta-like [Cetorhinus maximus]